MLRHLNVFASGLDCHNFRILLLFTVFVYQAGLLVHLTGDLRIALAAVVGGIVNLLGMRRTLCSACKIMKLMTTMITNVTKMTKM